MSNIDQAFINAYADQHLPAVPASRPSSYTIRKQQPASAASVRLFAHETPEGVSALRFDPPDHLVHPAIQPETSKQKLHSAVAAAQRASFTSVDQNEETILLPPLGNDRRPLSAFAIPPKPVENVFSPAFEVDGFQWPAITEQLLLSTRDLLEPVVNLLLERAQEGHALVGLVGTQSKVGCSTVTMCLAKMIAQAGTPLTVVDANFSQGDLATRLGLEFDQGWEDVLAGEIPLAECAVHSLADCMTLIPLGGPVLSINESLASIQTAVIAGVLRYHHDIVLVDLGTPQTPEEYSAVQGMVEHCRLDTTIIVAPSGSSDPTTLHIIDSLRQLLGSTCLGVIGNRSDQVSN
ncbi:CpsD/CapB family tyrosine-protein kinase [Bythopirellula polymerisocia]|uniref:Tyrosine kinase n=1 Tax=Bythopirellula polymerisocia TaxID=2528003 RepID=A0A5C6CWN5_9BACT|nr:CpsD/CapB family tyrosine-protein kinase [Bythopirellula polymerisocia]TWU27831.1 tyrosine kinase [Bythopirellula polymerisocia]